MATLSEHYVVDLVNQDLTVGEFLNPDTWHMESVRLPYDKLQGKPASDLARIEGEWFFSPTTPYGRETMSDGLTKDCIKA